MRRLILVISILSSISLANIQGVSAQEISTFVVAPAVINEKTKPRDILKYKIKINNPYQHVLEVYPLINDIDQTKGLINYQETSELDSAQSIAKWTKIVRGTAIAVGEEKEIDLEINVDGAAAPGKHFASLTFVEATNRPAAEGLRKSKIYPSIAISLDVEDNKIEKFNQERFITAREIYLKMPVTFDLALNNVGSVDVIPRGVVRIYDRRGKEVQVFPINNDNQSVSPDQKYQQKTDWTDQKAVGRYKAKLEFEYGTNDIKMIQDVVFFWVLPWQKLLILLAITLVLLILMVYLLFKQTYRPGPGPTQQSEAGVLNLRRK